MTIKERLEFCSICTNRKIDLKIGLVCSLSNEKPEFEDKCESFVKDEEEAARRLELKLKATGNSRTQNGSTKPMANKLSGLGLLILGIGTLFISMIVGGIMIVTGVSFLIKGFHQDYVLKENKRLNEKLSL